MKIIDMFKVWEGGSIVQIETSQLGRGGGGVV